MLIEAALKNVEVGCEIFFSLSGYVSAPRQTRLGVRTYERISLLASILPKVYIDKEWVTQEYLMQCKADDVDRLQACARSSNISVHPCLNPSSTPRIAPH